MERAQRSLFRIGTDGMGIAKAHLAAVKHLGGVFAKLIIVAGYDAQEHVARYEVECTVASFGSCRLVQNHIRHQTAFKF